jgi:hypothetical protein
VPTSIDVVAILDRVARQPHGAWMKQLARNLTDNVGGSHVAEENAAGTTPGCADTTLQSNAPDSSTS